MISLIIPTYNRAVVLKRALDSAMNVDYSPVDYEIIVVDNGSTDATPAVVQEAQDRKPKSNINYIREERLGLHNARHAGVWAAKGDILIFTDDDAIGYAPMPGLLTPTQKWSLPVGRFEPHGRLRRQNG